MGLGGPAAGAVRGRRRGPGMVRREGAGVGVVAAPAAGTGAALPGPPGHGVPLPRRRRAAARAAQQGGQVPELAAGLPRRRAAGDAAVPPRHEGARCVFLLSLSFFFPGRSLAVSCISLPSAHGKKHVLTKGFILNYCWWD